MSSFLKSEFSWLAPQELDIAFFGKGYLHSAGNLILLDPKFKQDELEANLVEEIVSVIAREQLNINPAQHPWLAEGLANYYKHLYYERFYPSKKLLGPFQIHSRLVFSTSTIIRSNTRIGCCSSTWRGKDWINRYQMT